MRMKSITPLLVSMACIFCASDLAAKSADADNAYYTTKDKEYYLTADQVLFIRPGLELEILETVIPDDRQLEVTFKLTDPAGLVLDRDGITTPGPVSTSFILAFIPAGEEAYLAYTSRIQTSPITGDSAEQASTDSGGTYTDLGDGSYMYKFATVLPEDYDMDATHTLGIYARRDLREFDLDRYVTNELEHFVPSGASEAIPRDIVKTETCNGRCHDPIAMHGGARTDVGLCILCHNPTQDIDPDTGNSFDMPLMTHKIHMGAGLTNGYNIIGYRQSNHDYSHVEYPAPINECEACHTGGAPTENFPMVASPVAALVCDNSGSGETTLTWQHTANVEIQIRTNDNPDGKLFARGGKAGSASDTMELIQTVPVNATVLGCVGNAPGTLRGEAGVQHTNWLDHPTRKNCGSCHDHVDFATGEGHSDNNIAQADDTKCDRCHKPGLGNEFDRSIRGTHLSLYKSAQFPGTLVEFISVINTDPGSRPTVTFSVGSKSGKLNPGDLNRLRFAITGPNEDFDVYIQETVGTNAVAAGGNWLYRFETPLPLDAAGSYTVSVEGRNTVTIDMGDEESDERDVIEASLMAFAVTDATATPRRMVVDDYNCESCHSNVSLHGGGRNNANYCNTCHTPGLLDITEPIPENVSMKWMIHKIHRGQDLENGYVVIRSRGTYDFSDLEYSGDLRNCDACHVNNSQQLPLPSGLLPTLTPAQWWDPTMPAAAACLSCHDGDDAAAHAYSNTTFFGESCGTCHGEGKIAAVDKVHAQ